MLVLAKNFPSLLYSETTKHEIVLKKNAKIIKRSHAYKDYASTCNVKILNCFNLELRLKNTEFAIRNKLKDLLTKLRGFKFVTTLIIDFRKIESDDATKYTTKAKQKQLLIKIILMMHLNQFILKLY